MITSMIDGLTESFENFVLFLNIQSTCVSLDYFPVNTDADLEPTFFVRVTCKSVEGV